VYKHSKFRKSEHSLPVNPHTLYPCTSFCLQREETAVSDSQMCVHRQSNTQSCRAVGGSEVKSGVKFHRPPKNCSDVCNVTATRLSMRSLREVIVLPLKAIRKGQGLNLYRPSVKHKSTYVNQQSKRNDHKQASEREKWGREA